MQPGYNPVCFATLCKYFATFCKRTQGGSYHAPGNYPQACGYFWTHALRFGCQPIIHTLLIHSFLNRNEMAICIRRWPSHNYPYFLTLQPTNPRGRCRTHRHSHDGSLCIYTWQLCHVMTSAPDASDGNLNRRYSRDRRCNGHCRC